jgi:hypothetical protein
MESKFLPKRSQDVARNACARIRIFQALVLKNTERRDSCPTKLRQEHPGIGNRNSIVRI